MESSAVLLPHYRGLVKNSLRKLAQGEWREVLQGVDAGVLVMRNRFVERHVAPELFALWAIELVLTFALALILLTPVPGSFSAALVHPAIMCALTVGFTAFVIGLYRPQIFEKARSLIVSSVVAALLSFPAVWIVSKILGLNSYWPVGYDPLRPVKIILIWSASVVCVRLAFLVATRLHLFVHRVAFIESDVTLATTAATRGGRKGFLEISVVRPEDASAFQLGAARIRTLVVCSGSEQAIVPSIADQYVSRGITLQNQAEFWERYLRRVDISNLKQTEIASVLGPISQSSGGVARRLFDIATSSALLITTLPIIMIVAALVKFDSPGSILYRQVRVGLNSEPFTLLKFRSMMVDAEASGPRWAQQQDPRVTRLGLFMRKTRIDELPQLLNILRGEMSFIGPRPERPHFVEQLSQIIPGFEERSRVKPGLTGWAQVNYPYGASIEDARAKLSYDLYYVKNHNILLDMLILLSTVRVILFQEGAR